MAGKPIGEIDSGQCALASLIGGTGNPSIILAIVHGSFSRLHVVYVALFWA
jgi:hypothetical protein